MPTGGLSLFGLHQFDYKDSYFNGQTILSQAAGYGVVVGYGAFFVVLTMVVTFLDRRFGGTKNPSEEFNTAGRSIKIGLVAVDVVSRWTWVATLLIAVNQAYAYGVTAAFWYGSAAVIQLFLFGILALELKRKAPMAHTVYFYLCFINNIGVSCILIIGAGNLISAVTGVNIYAAVVLIPLGVVIYIFSGGLKATFTSSYVHTIIFLHGNKHGSYMTMFSKNGFLFGMWNLVGSFGTLFADQAYWQGAITASPKAAFHGYILGGLLWFPIPFAMGLAALALDLPISLDEFN